MATMKRRKGKSNYEICYPLPIKLRTLLRTPALNRSLKTPDKAEARRRFPIKLVEVEAEVAGLMAKHFPDDESALDELKYLIEAYKTANDSTDNHGDLSDKDIIFDIMTEWATNQKNKRLRKFRGTTQLDHEKSRAENLASKADAMVRDAIDTRHRFSDLIEQWRIDVAPSLSVSTQLEYERAISRFQTWSKKLGYFSFEEIRRSDVRDFVKDTFQGRMGKTINLALGGLNSVWQHAMTIGWVDEEPLIWKGHKYQNNVRFGTGEKKSKDDEKLPFSSEDIIELLQRIEPGEFTDLFRLALVTGGGRSGEISAIRTTDVAREDDGYWIHLKGTKTDSADRRVPVPTQFSPLIDRLLITASDFLVPLYPGKIWNSERDRNAYINKEVNRKRRELALPRTRQQGFHSTRYTYMEILEGADVPISTVKLLVGHKRTDLTFGGYSKGGMVKLRDAVEHLTFPEEVVQLINQTR